MQCQSLEEGACNHAHKRKNTHPFTSIVNECELSNDDNPNVKMGTEMMHSFEGGKRIEVVAVVSVMDVDVNDVDDVDTDDDAFLDFTN